MFIDDATVRNLRARLLEPARSRQDAASDLARIADIARQEPSVAAIIAERIRADRLQWRHEVYSLPLGSPHTTIDETSAARCVAHAGCASLAATAMLELEERGGGNPEWAKALIAVAGDMGIAHLERMRSRPNWSDLLPSSDPMPLGLDALISPIADIRRRALEVFVTTPRPVHVRALLLAAELDRHVIRNVLHLSWTMLEVSAWLPLLVEYASVTRLTEQLARLPRDRSEFADALVATRARTLLLDLIEAGLGRARMDSAQELSPALRELETDGVVAFAERHMPDPRLTDDDRSLLEDAEVQLAAQAALLWGPRDDDRPDRS